MIQVGISGEYRMQVFDVDGELKTDSGYRHNAILDQGLNFLGSNSSTAMGEYCLLGSGSPTTDLTQTTMNNLISKAKGVKVNSKYDYVDSGDNTYRIYQEYKYEFLDLGDTVLSEVGLASSFTSSTEYNLCTHTGLKNILNENIEATVFTGERIVVYYRIWQVYNLLDTNYILNVTDGHGNSEDYNVVTRLANVSINANYRDNYAGVPWNSNSIRNLTAYQGDIFSVFGQPHIEKLANPSANMVLDEYVQDSFSIGMTQYFLLGDTVGSIRSIVIETPMGLWQFRLGNVIDDSPLIKTKNDILNLKFMFSWKRFKGELE